MREASSFCPSKNPPRRWSFAAFIAVVLVSAGASANPKGKAGWNGLRWGTGERQIAKRIEEKTQRCKVVNANEPDRCVVIEGVPFSVSWKTRLSNGKSGLSDIILRPAIAVRAQAPQRCRRAAQLLSLKYGQALSREPIDFLQAGLRARNLEQVWRSANTEVRLHCSYLLENNKEGDQTGRVEIRYSSITQSPL